MRYFNPRSREGSDPTAVFLLHFPSISIHAPARGATAGITATQNLSQDFNPRSREGSDTVCSPFVISSQYFNPRSREGSDLPSWCIWSMASIISIHAPARGATPPGYTECTTTGNFNPRSREGSDDLPDRQPAERDDFNPRSREGSDVIQFVLQAEFIKFQSTLPRGERLETQKTSGSQSEISIHAPARGATYSPHEIKERLQINFNPRSREGSDLFSVIHLCSLQDFNPRSREGSDVYIPLWIHLQHISIHAPARGATPFGRIFRLFAAISIHAPARGATAQSHPMKLSHKFQSTLPRGERLILFVSVTVVTPISIHAPARGATLSFQATGVNPVYFNPRSREGSDGLGDYKPQLAELFQSTLPRGERRIHKKTTSS